MHGCARHTGSQFAHARGNVCHLAGRVPKEEQLCSPLLSCLASTSLLSDLDVLYMRRVDKELRLEAGPLDDVAQNKGCVWTPSPDRYEYSREDTGRVFGRDCEHRAGKKSVWMPPGEPGCEPLPFFGLGQRLAQKGHETLAIPEGITLDQGHREGRRKDGRL